MKSLLVALLGIVWIGAAGLAAAEQTWTGKISDNLCNQSHDNLAGGAGLTSRECTIECVKAGGKYVLVDDKKNVLAITNQDFAGLPQHADHTVKLTGELKDKAITVTKVEMVGDAK